MQKKPKIAFFQLFSTLKKKFKIFFSSLYILTSAKIITRNRMEHAHDGGPGGGAPGGGCKGAKPP